VPNHKSSLPGRQVRDQARQLVEQLSPDATWDDLMYQIYVRQAIEKGLSDSVAGRTVSVREVRARFGLSA
jgi:hypothetical protein